MGQRTLLPLHELPRHYKTHQILNHTLIKHSKECVVDIAGDEGDMRCINNFS